jgi:hypothetical protein
METLKYRAKGFNQSIPLGLSVMNIELDGNAKTFLGLRVDLNSNINLGYQVKLGLIIGSERVFENVAWTFLNGREAGFSGAYYPFVRDTSGNKGNIQLLIQSENALISFNVIVYYAVDRS